MKAGLEAPELLQLPLLPLFQSVLLPGGFLRVLIPKAWRKSAALVQHLLQQQGGEVYVAAVPYFPSRSLGDEDAAEQQQLEENLDLDRLHSVGTAARVLQLLRRTESGGWAVMLEGRCRVRVRDVTLSNLQEMFMASVEQLDYFDGSGPSAAVANGAAKGANGRGPLKSGASGKRGPGAAEEGGAPVNKWQEELVQELLQATRQLFMLLQGGAEGRETGARVTKMLQAQGPARVADLLGALVARDAKARLALLSEPDVSRRLELVRDGMAKLLAAATKVAGGGGDLSASSRALVPAGGRVSRRGGGLPRGFRLSDFGGGGAEGSEEEDEGKEELRTLLKKLQEANPPAEVLRVALREYKRLARSNEQHPGYAMSLAYLETLAELPWDRWSHQQARPGSRSQPPQLQQGAEGGAGPEGAAEGSGSGGELSLQEVRERLDAAHYGLDRIKERIVQYVAVQRLRGWDARAPILCFIGPPGVGKTSLARCVGEVLARPFQRISLGGVRDEAEVRGHRRTYIGAMPGRVIQAIRRAGVRDPVLLLDEVDKMGRDARGDPAAALLEVLDPEQNHAFVDTYLGVPFDLSSVVFVSTANRAADIPPPLLDRMEVVNLAGYTLDEKLHIAERHLVPRVLGEHGLLPGQLAFPREALRLLVEGYTREAGVRTLARCLAAVCRHVAVQVVAEREREGGGAAQLVAGPQARPGRAPGGSPADEEEPLPTLAGGAASALVAAAGSGALGARRRPAVSAGSLQLWGLLSTLSPLLAQQAPARGGGSRSTREPPTSLGGYPWQHLQQPRGSWKGIGTGPPSGSPKAHHAQQGGGWFSWLPWARQHAEQGEDEEHSSEGHGPPEPPAGVDPWGPSAAATSWADRSMSLAGSMQSMGAAPGAAEALPSSVAPRQALQLTGPLAHATAGLGGAAQLVEGEQGPGGLVLPLPSGSASNPLREIVVDEALIEEVLGPRRYTGHDNSERVASPGTAAGLVWTSVGGQVQYIECLCVGASRGEGAGTLTLTGQLGDVLEESARIALSWVRAHAQALGLPAGAACPATTWDVHIHLPAGAVPKDGPSAGVTLATALVSLFTGRCVRADTAMTGELTLRGLVLPVGGMKEKLLAAHTAGMARVIVPARNMRDVQADVPAEVRDALEIVPAERLEDALRHAFDPPLDLQQLAPRARL